MNRYLTSFLGWFGWGRALGENTGKQQSGTSSALIEGTVALAPDSAMQLSTVWSCVWLLANVVASLPLFVYANVGGKRELARDTRLYQLLHDSPNSRMTPVEFWVALLLNLLLRGNAYARIERAANGEAVALWPMAADQVEVHVLDIAHRRENREACSLCPARPKPRRSPRVRESRRRWASGTRTRLRRRTRATGCCCCLRAATQRSIRTRSRL